MTSKPRAKESKQRQERAHQRRKLVEALQFLSANKVITNAEFWQHMERVDVQFADIISPE